MAPDLARSWEISRPTSPSLPTTTGSSYSLPSRVRRAGAGAGERTGDSSTTSLVCGDIRKAPRAPRLPESGAPVRDSIVWLRGRARKSPAAERPALELAQGRRHRQPGRPDGGQETADQADRQRDA